MAELKTKQTRQSVDEFINSIVDEQVKSDCKTLISMMEESTGAQAAMWGTSIVGFGTYHYKYASGREGDWFQVGFSPRKQNLTLYLMHGIDQFEDQLQLLGKHKTGKACLYVKNLSDINSDILKQLIDKTVERNSKA